MYRDRWHDHHESIIDICEYFDIWEEELQKKIGKNTERIRKGRKTSIKYMDRWHDRHESIIDICEYHRMNEKYQSAHGTNLISEAKSKSVNDCATDSVSASNMSFLFYS